MCSYICVSSICDTLCVFFCCLFRLSLIIMVFVNYGGGKYWFFKHESWNGKVQLRQLIWVSTAAISRSGQRRSCCSGLCRTLCPIAPAGCLVLWVPGQRSQQPCSSRSDRIVSGHNRCVTFSFFTRVHVSNFSVLFNTTMEPVVLAARQI